MLSGPQLHVLGPRYDRVSIPYLTVFTLFVRKVGPLKLYEIFLRSNMFFIIVGLNLFIALYISVANTCKFLSCIVTELSLASSSAKGDKLSL